MHREGDGGPNTVTEDSQIEPDSIWHIIGRHVPARDSRSYFCDDVLGVTGQTFHEMPGHLNGPYVGDWEGEGENEVLPQGLRPNAHYHVVVPTLVIGVDSGISARILLSFEVLRDQINVVSMVCRSVMPRLPISDQLWAARK